MCFEYSIVATSFNDEKTIIDYLKTVSSQSLMPSEIVIADGGSKDNTVVLIEEFAKKIAIPIKVLSGKRLNISEGYNAAIKASSYSWIGITGIGNTYDMFYFEELYKYVNEYDVSYSLIRGLQDNSFSEKYADTFLNGNYGHDIGMPSNHGCLIKKSIFEENDYFYEKFVYAGEDAEFYDILKKKDYRMKAVPEAYSFWHIPRTFQEYVKQVKNYTIGDMQIKENKLLVTSCIKKLLSIVLAFCALCFVIFKANYLAKIVVVVSGMSCIMIWKLMNRKKSLMLLLYNRFAPAFFIILNRKYLDTKYKVDRKKMGENNG